MATRPTAAPAIFPFPGHRTVAEGDSRHFLAECAQRDRAGRVARDAEIVDALRENYNATKVAQRFGLTRMAVWNIGAKHGVTAPREIRAAARQERIAKILSLKSQGVNQAAIAERLGLSQQRVSQIIRQSHDQRAHQITKGDSLVHAGSVTG